MNIRELERVARHRGVDQLGIASSAEVDRQLPADLRLSLISAQMTRVLVLARHMPKGVMWARHAGTKQYAAARSLKMLGEAAVHLAAAIEASGAQAMPLAPVAIDFGSRGASLNLCFTGMHEAINVFTHYILSRQRQYHERYSCP